MVNSKPGVLLINLGTTAAPTTEKVHEYLKEFLMDKWVVDIPFVFRWLLVHGIILRKRPAMVAELYKRVWKVEGSPLLHYSQLFEKKLKIAAGEDFDVALAMRYGQPSIESALERLKNSSSLIIFPLYPQYSLAATQSSLEQVGVTVKKLGLKMPMHIVPEFYNEPTFIEAFRQVADLSIKTGDYDHVLFSFHGLPERQVKKTESIQGTCLSHSSCCEQMTSANAHCYRAQCHWTARQLAEVLGIKPGNYTTSFQSRLGRTPWIKPHSDVLYEEFPKRGIRKLIVISPSFVADCLETLEEIAIRGRDQFVRAGGQELKMVSSLNDHPAWIKSAKEIIQKYIKISRDEARS